MDLKAIMSTMLSNESIDNMAKVTKSTPEQVRGVLSSALPSLLNGAGTQANDESTASGFAGALLHHAGADTGNLSGFLGKVDLADGAKIVAHLLGGSSAAQTQAAAQNAGVSEAKANNILSAAAPLLMSLLGQQSAQESSSGLNIAGLMGNLLGSGDVSSLLGGLLGSETASGTKPDSKKGSLLNNLMGLLK